MFPKTNFMTKHWYIFYIVWKSYFTTYQDYLVFALIIGVILKKLTHLVDRYSNINV